MPATNVDFKFIRENADISKVLATYGYDLQKDGSRQGQFACLCPFHDDHKPSLKVNVDRNIFNCFVCDTKGNVLELVRELDGSDLRAAAKHVAEICGIPTSANGQAGQPASRSSATRRKPKPAKAKQTEPEKPPPQSEPSTEEPKGEDVEGGIPYNSPLPFELKSLDTEHPFITDRGISEEARAEFGLGIASKGMMKGRLVFPIHNKDGQLVAYCSRFVGDEPPDDEPKYKQPPNFQKQLELFNWHRAKDATDETLVLVESFFSAIKLHMLGYRVASPMGHSLSKEQIALLLEADVPKVVLLYDGDDPGRAALINAGRELVAAGIPATAPCVSAEFKPHRASEEELEALLNV